MVPLDRPLQNAFYYDCDVDHNRPSLARKDWAKDSTSFISSDCAGFHLLSASYKVDVNIDDRNHRIEK